MSADQGVALVTGGARRVGRAICVELARTGYQVLLTYRTSADEAEQTRQTCESHGVKAHALSLDLADADSIQALSDEIHERCERLDVLVHNASKYQRTDWGAVTTEDLESHLRINAIGPALLTQSLRDLLARAGGRVIVMGDMHVLGRPRRGYLAYNMSKAAITEMVRSLARELAPEVRINGIAPGVVAWPKGTDPEEIAQYEKRIALGRSGTPEDAAGLAIFLAHYDRYITGQVITLDGGRSLA